MTLTSAQVYELANTINERYGVLMAKMHEDAVRTATKARGPGGGSWPERDETLLREIRELDAARARIAVGCLGRCSICEGSIAFDRLLAHPAANCCSACEDRLRSGQRTR
jgi:hypothetical protein